MWVTWSNLEYKGQKVTSPQGVVVQGGRIKLVHHRSDQMGAKRNLLRSTAESHVWESKYLIKKLKQAIKY